MSTIIVYHIIYFKNTQKENGQAGTALLCIICRVHNSSSCIKFNINNLSMYQSIRYRWKTVSLFFFSKIKI